MNFKRVTKEKGSAALDYYVKWWNSQKWYWRIYQRIWWYLDTVFSAIVCRKSPAERLTSQALNYAANELESLADRYKQSTEKVEEMRLRVLEMSEQVKKINKKFDEDDKATKRNLLN